ncbi:MAG: flagellar motor switch protein FliM, partial [Burkholderiales bacterium]|nr:flagellar motor switch protein FliM [Burkholderiales bacterium]
MNQQILSQDEVDALLQGITGESQKLEQEEQQSEGIRDYDLASQERIVRGRMPTMEIINERFARNIRIGLFNLIRKSPEVSIGGIRVQKYSAFLREIVVPTNFNIVSIKPLRGSGLIECDPTLVFAVIDALFGGAGKYHTRIEGRDFSPTELRVILRLVECIIGEYKKAWTGIYPVEMEYQRSEMQPQFANIATPS